MVKPLAYLHLDNRLQKYNNILFCKAFLVCFFKNQKKRHQSTRIERDDNADTPPVGFVGFGIMPPSRWRRVWQVPR